MASRFMKLILCGPRKSGKTTLAKMFIERMGKQTLLVDGRWTLTWDYNPEVNVLLWDNTELDDNDMKAIEKFVKGDLIVTVTRDHARLIQTHTPVFRLLPLLHPISMERRTTGSVFI